jgi:ribosomal protein S18 acetylase RimI-like enzyme
VQIHRVLGQGGETPTDAFLLDLNEPLLAEGAHILEVFNLWVHPDCRRQGLATRLKLRLDTESKQRGIGVIYTHTELANTHVIELNEKMGYRKIRQGLIWNDTIRVSLIKELD